ncbi:pancreatic secretory granule membrane major glycoprotein GP2-like [Haliotis cracherodii]|uniref:pancreatic secretory granule membrane major glycoprotein GP2-like n=1 Tax=Haliotis cracherodii TaxID=6455 RepID=UPI0039E809FD
MVRQQNVFCGLMVFITGFLAQSVDDPCANYTDFKTNGDRSPRCPYQKTDENCDEFLTPSWFRIKVGEEDEFPKMTSHCPEENSCGANYPIWLNGTHPDVKDGIANRTVCLRYGEDCCDQMRYIQIKNCTDFYVYFLNKAAACAGRYCFDSDAACPTPPPTSTSSPTTSTTVNSTATVSMLLQSRVLTYVLSVHAILIF